MSHIPAAWQPIRQFRQQHMLPDDFGIARFEPKDFTGLGTIEGAGAALNHLRQQVVASAAHSLPLARLPQHIEALCEQFHRHLLAINAHVGLQEVEIEYATAGFADVLQALLYALMDRRTSSQRPSFDHIHMRWLMDSVRITATVHEYTHQGQRWQVQVVQHAYGRAGLFIRTSTQADGIFVYDSQYICPAEGFMFGLLSDVAEALMAGLA